MRRFRYLTAALVAVLAVPVGLVAIGQFAASVPTPPPAAAFHLYPQSVAEGEDIVLNLTSGPKVRPGETYRLVQSTVYGEPTGTSKKFVMPADGHITWHISRSMGFYWFRIAKPDGGGGDLVKPIQAQVRPNVLIEGARAPRQDRARPDR